MAKGHNAILYGVRVAVVEELDPDTLLPLTDGLYHRMNCAQSVKITPRYSQGTEEIIRQDKLILDTYRTPDLLYGYKIVLTDTYFSDSFIELLEGGTYTFNDYQMARIEDGFVTKPFRLTLWTENAEGYGHSNYVMIRYNYCYGKVDELELKNDFYFPKFTIEAREPTQLAGRPIRDVYYTNYLPDDPDSDLPVRYGMRIEKNNPDPDARVQYMYDAIGHVPAYMDFTGGKSKNLINDSWSRQSNITTGGITFTRSEQGSVWSFSGTLIATSASVYIGRSSVNTDGSFKEYLKAEGLWKVGTKLTASIDRELSSATINGTAIDMKTFVSASRDNARGQLFGFVIPPATEQDYVGDTTYTLSTIVITEEMINRDVNIVVRLLIYGQNVGDTLSGTIYIQIEEGLYDGVALVEKTIGKIPAYEPNVLGNLASVNESGFGGTGYQSPNDTSQFVYGSWETNFFVRNNKPVMMNKNGDIEYELAKDNQYKRLGDYSKTITLAASDFEVGNWSTTSGNTGAAGNQNFARTKNDNGNFWIAVEPGEQLIVNVEYPNKQIQYRAQVLFYDESNNYINYSTCTLRYHSIVVSVPSSAKRMRFFIYDETNGINIANIAGATIEWLETRIATDLYSQSSTLNAMSEIPLTWLYQYEDDDYEYCIMSNVQFDENYTAWAHQNRFGQIMDTTYIGMMETSYTDIPLRTLQSKIGTIKVSENYQSFITQAQRNGPQWHIMSNAKWNLLRMMAILISKSEHGQQKFGFGMYNSMYRSTTGAAVGAGQFSGTTTTINNGIASLVSVKLFYIENIWGNYHSLMIGLRLNYGVWQKINGNYIFDGNFTDIGMPEESQPPATVYYSKTNMVDGARTPMNASGGSQNTYVCDGVYNLIDSTPFGCVLVGGSSLQNNFSGINYITSHGNGNDPFVATRLIYDKDE